MRQKKSKRGLGSDYFVGHEPLLRIFGTNAERIKLAYELQNQSIWILADGPAMFADICMVPRQFNFWFR
jgi:hypothetical protein